MTETILDALISVLKAEYFSDFEYIAKCPVCMKQYLSLGIVKDKDWLTLCCNECSYESIVKSLVRKYSPLIQYNGFNSESKFKYWYAASDDVITKPRSILVDNSMAAASLVSYGFTNNFGFNVITISDVDLLDWYSQGSNDELYIWPTHNQENSIKCQLIYDNIIALNTNVNLLDVRCLPLNSNAAHFTWHECLKLINYNILANFLTHKGNSL